MSATIDLVVDADGLFVLAEDARDTEEYKCIICNELLIYTGSYFQHGPNKKKACSAVAPKSNYHRVLKACQTRQDWKLRVQCSRVACTENVAGPYTVSRECCYKIIVRALRTHQYCVKAGSREFDIGPLFCKRCDPRTSSTQPQLTQEPAVVVDDRVAAAEHAASHAINTLRATRDAEKAAMEEHQRALQQRMATQKGEEAAFDQYQTAHRRHIEAQDAETAASKRSQDAINDRIAASFTEKEAVANVEQVRKQVRVEAETAARVRAEAAAKATAEAAAKATAEAATKATAEAAAKATAEAATKATAEAEAKATAEAEAKATAEAVARVRAEAAAAMPEHVHAPTQTVKIIDVPHKNVAREQQNASALMQEYVNSVKFNISGARNPRNDVRLWLTQAVTNQVPRVCLPPMKTTWGVRSAPGFETDPTAYKNLDLIVANVLVHELLTSIENCFVQFIIDKCTDIFGSKLPDRVVKAKLRPLIRPLSVDFLTDLSTSCVRVRIPPNHLERMSGACIQPGEAVTVTVKLEPYNNYEADAFGLVCVCTNIVWDGVDRIFDEADNATMTRELITTFVAAQAEKAQVEAEKAARMEAEKAARVEAEKARMEAEKLARMEAEKLARVEAEKAARVEAEMARMEAEKLARVEAEKAARVEAEMARVEAEKGAKAARMMKALKAARIQAETAARIDAVERAARMEAAKAARNEWNASWQSWRKTYE